MGASTHAVGGATAAFQAIGHAGGGNLVCVTKRHGSLSANLSANDVLQMIKVPKGAVVVDGWIALDTAASSGWTFTVGDGADPDRYIQAVSVSVSQTFHNFRRDLSGATTGLGHQYSADDTIDVKFTEVTATKALRFTLTVMYLVDGQTSGKVLI